MKALVYDEYTTDDNFSKILKIKDIPIPEPKSNEVVFKVKAAALNYDDAGDADRPRRLSADKQ